MNVVPALLLLCLLCFLIGYLLADLNAGVWREREK